MKAQELLARRQDAMRRLVAESNALSVTGRPVLHRHPAREWAGDRAGGARIASSGRKVDELLAGKAAQAAMARAGVSKSAVKRAIADEMKRQGMEPSDFPTLTAGEQRHVFSGIVATLKKTAKPKPIGKHAALFARIEGDHTAADDLAKTNPNFKPLDPKWAFNCQRCVSAYEARRRGFDVTAKPRGGKGDRLPYMTDQNGWPHVYENASLVPCFSNSGANTRGKVEKLMEQWGDGARAIVRVQWKGGNSGHVFIAERVNGATRFVDPQSNDGDCSRYFAAAKKNQTYCMRIDDRRFTDLIKQCCKEKQ